MIHKVTVESQVGSGMTITQSFEQVVDGDDEAEEFGRSANTLALAWLDGWRAADEST